MTAPRPILGDFATSAAAWLTAGAAHHTVMSTAVGIDVFEDYIYGVTYINNRVFKIHKFGHSPLINLTGGLSHASDVVLYHQHKQPEVTNPCDRKKCEWLCLLSPSGPVCTCPNGKRLDNGTCVPVPSPTPPPASLV